MSSPCERLSKREREATPIKFAEYLVSQVRQKCQCYTVAALFLQFDSVYRYIEGVECWGLGEDAMTYNGPHPIIAHPTCGPWGKLAWNSKQDKSHGIRALTLVHKYRGVIEQPVGSQLFHYLDYHLIGQTETVLQGDYGHRAPKPTILYWVI